MEVTWLSEERDKMKDRPRSYLWIYLREMYEQYIRCTPTFMAMQNHKNTCTFHDRRSIILGIKRQRSRALKKILSTVKPLKPDNGA